MDANAPTAIATLCVALWLLGSGFAAASLGDAVRAWTKSRRGGVVATRLMFLLVGVGGAVAVQAVL